MDKQISPNRFKQYRKVIILVSVILIIVTVMMLPTTAVGGRSQNVKLSNVFIASVALGSFEDALSVRGRVVPKSSVYLDTTFGGRVEQRLVEQGQFVEQGQPLVQLSNTSLQLDVMSREAQVTEQLNFLRNTQMTMETNRLNLRRDLIEIDHQIKVLSRQLKQSTGLFKQGALAKEPLDEIADNLEYYQQRRELTVERQAQERSIRQVQLTQLEDSATMLEKNLRFARQNISNLLVKAPVSGYLSEFEAEVGESKRDGARLGQIDIPGQFKLVVQLDEYYLPQVSVGMAIIIQFDSGPITTQVTKVDSRVVQSQFHIEVDIPTEILALKRGQSLDGELTLSDGQTNSLLLPRGAFFNTSGGQWAFVLNKNGTQAFKRSIEIGKKNKHYFHVISGLAVGERVITSSYSHFDNATSITLTN